METSTRISPENCFKRFLYTGQEVPKYVAGSHKSNDFEKSTVFANIACNTNSACKTVKIFEKAKKNSSYTAPIIFALAATIQALSKEDKDYEIRELFYQTVPNILENSEELMLFVKYTSDLELKRGTRWQNCIRTWYMKSTFSTLVKDIVFVKSRHGWTHRDLLRLIHLGPLYSNEQIATLKYICSGVEALTSLQVPNDVVNELRTIEKLRKCHDFAEAAALIRKINGLKFANMPKHLIHTQKDNSEVWKALIDRMSPSDVLLNIEYLQLAGMLEEQNVKEVSRPQLTSYLVSALSKITAPPILAYIVYCNYKNNRGLLRVVEKGNKVKDPKGKELEVVEKKSTECVKGYISKTKKLKMKYKNRCQPANDLIISLKNLVDRSLLSVEKLTNLTCMITIDMREHMFKSFKQQKEKRKAAVNVVEKNEDDTETEDNAENKVKEINETEVITVDDVRKSARCYYSKKVVPGHAGILLALYLTKYMRQTYVSVYTNDGVKLVKMHKTINNLKQLLTMDEAEVAFKAVHPGKASLNKPFDWAITNKKAVDLFINVVDTATRLKEHIKPVRPAKDFPSALANYKNVMNSPDTRAIMLSLSTHNAVTTNNSQGGLLDIAGFDENITELISNFALGEFE